MLALSVKQPWAWFILHAGKDCENRSWKFLSKFKGNLLIHAGKGMTKEEYNSAVQFARSIGVVMPIPAFEDIKRGGIIGMVEVVNHVRYHKSKWFEGPTAFVLRNPYPLPFRPYAGQLGMFEVT